MPHISALKSSKFLTKADCNPAILVTITGCHEYNVASDGAPEELKWCLSFAEVEKPMVLNSTNGQIIAGFIGSDNTDDWTNRKVVLYMDPNVSFGGKLIGGIRARAPKQPQAKPAAVLPQAPPAAAPPPPQPASAPSLPVEGEAQDDVPF